MRANSVISQKIWDSGYQNHEFFVSKNERENRFIEEFLPNQKGDLLEIGCFPGRFLPLLSQKGYTLSGIDLTPRLSELPYWLTSIGCSIDKFYCEDFCKWTPDKKYDAVVSFGFVEHFINWHDIFEKHCNLVKEDGYLLVTFPNFKGKIQSFLHNWLDKTNFSYHYQGAMDIRQYRKICLKNNFEIIFCGYWGGFDFWLGGDAHPTFSQQYFLRLLYKMARHGSKIPSYSWYSPYCGIVAKKKGCQSHA